MTYRITPCRVRAWWGPKRCCYGGCLDDATHAIDVQEKDRVVEHLRCPTHLEHSKQKQAKELLQIRELVT